LVNVNVNVNVNGNVNLTLEAAIPALASGDKVLVTANIFTLYLIFDFLDRR
jgi:hypothetical protein